MAPVKAVFYLPLNDNDGRNLDREIEEAAMRIVDENVEMVRRVREELIAKYGGLEGWIDHLQALEKKRPKRKTQPGASHGKSKPAANGAKRSSAKSKSRKRG